MNSIQLVKVPILVVFHMNGCGHCKAVSGPDSVCAGLRDVHVMEVESEDPLTELLGIQSFPTIWLSSPDKVVAYNSGERSTDALQDWIFSKIAQKPLGHVLV